MLLYSKTFFPWSCASACADPLWPAQLLFPYVEPAVNRQPGFRQELVEQGVLPSKSNTKTVSNGARVEPRTRIVLTMKMLF